MLKENDGENGKKGIPLIFKNCLRIPKCRHFFQHKNVKILKYLKINPK